MGSHTTIRVSSLALAWLIMLAALAQAEPASVTMRGETRAVWPADDLRSRGFDVADIPRDENAAWVYIEAINAYSELPRELGGIFDHVLDAGWPKHPQAKALAKWLDQPENKKALELARRAAEFEHCQIPYYGNPRGSVVNMLLPSLSHHRILAKMLVVNGKRREAGGKYDEALEDYLVAARMGSHVAQGITLIEALVGVACDALAAQAIHDLVLRRNLPQDRLERLLNETSQMLEHAPDMQRGLVQEQAFGLGMVDEFASQPSHFITNPAALSTLSFLDSVNVPTDSGWGALEARLGKLVFPDRAIKQNMRRYYTEVQRRTALPASEAGWNDNWEEEMISNLPAWDMISRTMLPSLSRANVLAQRLITQMRMTRVSIALRLYALTNQGGPPEDLEYLKRWLGGPDDLIDPFSGDYFVYRRTEKGWLLYSFSDNLTDDGGIEGNRPFDKDHVIRFPPPKQKAFED